ncbi:MAG: glycosyltransferase [Bacteroidales bacterium]
MIQKKKPKIAFFGSSLTSAYWNGAATYYRGIIKYLHRLGYHITFYEPDAFDRQKHRDLPDPPWATSVVYANDPNAVEDAVDQAREADILIKASGVGVFDDFLEAALLRVRKPHQKTIFWDVDAPATLDGVFNNPDSLFRDLIPEYDCILTYGGGPRVVEAYHSLGARECIPVYNALDPETHYPVPPEDKFRCDMAFLGNRLPDREERVMEFFVQVAAEMPNRSFLLGGSGWDKVKLPENIRYTGHVYTHQHNAFNTSPGVVLNISRQSMASYGFSPATRVFEAAGAGACIITDFWEGIDAFFEPEKEIWVASDGRDVKNLLEKLDTQQIRSTGKAALAKVLEKHTYRNRAKLLSSILTGMGETTNHSMLKPKSYGI